MTIDTLFDLASLTKTIATATAVLKLSEQLRLDVGAPVVQYLPEFTSRGKDAIFESSRSPGRKWKCESAGR